MDEQDVVVEEVKEDAAPPTKMVMVYLVEADLLAEVVDALRELPHKTVARPLARLTSLRPQQAEVVG